MKKFLKFVEKMLVEILFYLLLVLLCVVVLVIGIGISVTIVLVYDSIVSIYDSI